jgi:YD repeat-containing protein
VLVTFAYDAKGKVTNESYYGGDRTAGEAGAGTQALCTLSQLGALDYQLTHKPWSPATNDFTETSTYAGTGFLVRDMTVDRNTGAVASTRDASGVQTTYTYDVMGRLTSVRPAGRAWSTYRYPTPTDPTLEVNQAPGGVPSTTTPKSTYEFDGLGRLTRETTAMPAGQTSFRKTEYDGLGRRKSVSELLAVGATTPYPGTAFTYDYAGRVLTTTAADGALTSFSYDGPAKKTRTSKIWTGGTGDTAVTTTEEYDGYGRLVAVTEKSGPTSSLNRIGADVRTEYGYDGADHLVSVIMNRTAAGPVQRRTFDYDGRGFLRWESQPESGMTSYKYDARGHVLEIRRGAADTQFDLNYKYDAAERMTRVEGRNPDFAVGDPETNRFRVIKQFEFGTANAGADKRLGKLTRATRYNYLWYGPVRIVHAYEYTDTAGRTTRRTTTIDASAQTSGAFTTDITLGMNYDEFDQTTSMEYPMCTLCGGPASFPTRSNVVWAYNRGRFQTLSSFIAGTTYWPNGLRKDLLHSNGITDTQTAGAMPRPTQLKFDLHDRCVIPAISVQPVSTSVASAGGTATLSVSVSGTGPFQYAWMSGGNVVGTTPTVTVTVNATSNYYVEVTGPCGFVDSNTAKVTVASCATPETGMVTAAPQPDRSWILTARPVARQNATYEWRRLSDNQVVGTLTTLNVAALSVSTTYAFTVTDSCGTTTSNVTVSVPLAITTTGLVATAINNATQIAVSWPAVSGATTYVVQRRAGAEWTEVGRPTATTFTDTTVVAAKTYAYRVYAIGNSSAQSGFSNSDVATTSVITPPLAGNTITATSVNGMLAVVNGVRATAGWPAVTWSNILASTDPVPNPGAGILGRHITSCRARMNEALQALGVPVQDYTDADLRNVAMKALHVAEIEQRAQ